jgi:Flp pilus assembly protein TadG
MRIRDERGNVSIITALAGLPILLAAGTAIDYSYQAGLHAELQQAVDAAALAGTIAKKKTNAERQTRAANALAANFTWSGDNPSATYVFEGAKTTVTATITSPNSFMSLGGVDTTVITARAVAYAGLPAPICMLALEPAATKAFQVNSGSSIAAPGCAIQVNSADHEALYANSGSIVTSEATCIVGDYATNSGSRIRPTPETSCPPVADPLAYLQPPASAAAACNYNDVAIQGGENRSFAPGVFCGNFLVQSGGRATLEPGIHVFRDAELVVNSGGILVARDVMIFLTADKARLNLNSGSSLDLSAPRTGVYAGIAVYQDRAANTAPHILNSESSSRIEGVVYVPSNDLHINSSSRLGDTSPWWAVIARKFETNSSSHIHFNVDYAVSAVPVPPSLTKGNDVALVE